MIGFVYIAIINVRARVYKQIPNPNHAIKLKLSNSP